jgi:glutathione-regulated potassium-efflux system ancillary protein KefF
MGSASRPASIVIVYAHPYPRHSRAGRTLLAAASAVEGVAVRSLYALYPDFAIDVAAEQEAIAAADVLVWQCPLYWYGVPSLLHLWFEKVLTQGFAHGAGGAALSGKPLLWVTTTGTPATAYRRDGIHSHPFASFIHPIEETARFCGLGWEVPLVVHGAHDIDEGVLADHAGNYRRRLEALQAEAAGVKQAGEERVG